MTARKRNGQFSGGQRRDVEGSIQRTFIQQFKMHCGACEGFSIPNEHTKKSEVTRLLGMGMRPGAADYCVLWAEGISTRVCFIEFKSPKGRVQPTQEAFGQAMSAINCDWVVCRSWQEAWVALQERGAPLARHWVSEPVGRFVLPPERSEPLPLVEIEHRGTVAAE